MGSKKRRDSKGRILFTGESQEKDGSYTYRYNDLRGNRKKVRSWKLTATDPVPKGKKVNKSLREQEKEIQAMLDSGVYDDGVTVGGLIQRYLQTKTNLRFGTHDAYVTFYNVVARCNFGERKAKDITYSEAKLFLIGLNKDGLSYGTVNGVKGILRAAFQMGLEDRVLAFNPFSFELRNIIANNTKKKLALTSEQEQRYLEFIKNDSVFSKYYDTVYVLFKTGLRVSEFCGLVENDVNYEEHTLTVERQLRKNRYGELLITSTKTTKGSRILPISDEVEECFRRMVAKRKGAGPAVDGVQGFFCLTLTGVPKVNYDWDSTFARIYKKYTKVHEDPMPVVTPHVCRHTYCSRMAAAGMNPKALQYLMGHSNIEITMDVYTHFGVEDVKKALMNLYDS